MAALPDQRDWPHLSALLDQALDLDAAERARWLAALQASDPEAARALAPLLAQQTWLGAHTFLETPAVLPGDDRSGQRIGPYRLERELGQGGMGTVWLARRDDGRFEGQVAIKFIQLGLGSPAARERFEREGRILARLAHPHIARLVDAGTADNGLQPYLVLEYVDGQPIDQHCQQRQADVAQRLALVLDVLDAVAHAHARLTLHRDLKPSNILVTADGRVKLLDFGIAKLLDDPALPAGATALTAAAGRVFTPLHAAPEQVQGDDVTTATDVYALGVLLFLLLSGRHPTGAANGSVLDQVRAVVDVQPLPLSQAALSGRRGDPVWQRRARALRGDLDCIVAKALRKSPAERYANAADLAADLRLHLAGEAVRARPDAAARRLRRFVVRHRWGVAAGTVVAAAVGIGLSTTLWQARESRVQQARAEELLEFMLGDLRTRLVAVGRLDVMDSVGARALAYYDAQAPSRLDADSIGRRARALLLMGEIAQLRGQLDVAQRLLDSAAASTGVLLQRDPANGQRLYDHAQSVFWTGYMAYERGQLDQAERAFSDYRDLAERLRAVQPQRPEWAGELGMAYSNLGTVLIDRGRPAQALEALQRTRTLHLAALPQRPELAMELALNFGWLAAAHAQLGRPDAALAERLRQIDHLQTMPDAARSRDVQSALAVAQGESAQRLLELGRAEEALRHATTHLAVIDPLVAEEPANRTLLRSQVLARVTMAELLHLAGQASAARAQADGAQAVLDTVPGVGAVADWQVFVRGQVLLQRVAVAGAAVQAPLDDALERFVGGVAAFESGGRVLNAREHLAAAGVQLALGDRLAARGSSAAAGRHWQAAHARLAARAAANDLVWLALLAQARARVGDMAGAGALVDSLAATPLRHPRHQQFAASLQRSRGAR